MQGRHSSWFVATVVVLLGVLVAFAFQQEPAAERDEGEIDFSYLADGLIWQEEPSLARGQAAPAPRQRLVPYLVDREVAVVGATETADPPVPEPPPMPIRYGELAQAYQSNPAASQPQVTAKVTTDRGDRPVAPPRLHRIVDGDTLESLALRYLGDVSRAEELYRTNRDMLDGPDLLPVGKQIRIPRATSPARPSPRAQSSSLPPLRRETAVADTAAGPPPPDGSAFMRPAMMRSAPKPEREPAVEAELRRRTFEQTPRTNLRPLQ